MASKLLIVSWTLHPWPTGSSVIVNNIARLFPREELILFGEKHKSLKSRWPSDFPQIFYSDPNCSVLGRGKYLLRWVNLNKIIRQLCILIRKEKVHKILCIYPDDFYLYVAYRASKKLNIPFYSWFHNTYFDNVTGYRRILASWLQPRVMKNSRVNFVMSEGIKDYYNKKYPGYTFVTLVHGFPIPKNLSRDSRINGDGKVKFLYAGNLNESCRDASIRLINAVLSNEDYEVHVFAGTPIEVFERLGFAKKSNFHFHGFIPLEDLYGILPDYDIMLLPHGFKGGRTRVEYETIFPTRTIPLLTSGRPILAHTPPGVFLTRFLEKHSCAYIVDSNKIEHIHRAIEVLLTDAQLVKGLVDNARKVCNNFRIEEVVQKLKTYVSD